MLATASDVDRDQNGDYIILWKTFYELDILTLKFHE